MSEDGTRDGLRPIRVRADAALADKIHRSDRGSSLWVTTREGLRMHQRVRLELGLGPLADEILIDAVVVDVDRTGGGAPEVLLAVDALHEERFAYVYDVIHGRRDVVTRRYRRVAARFPVVWTQGGASHRSFTADIAAGGTFVIGSAPLPGSSVELEIWLDAQEAVELSGLVTWVGHARGEDGFGVQFRNLEAASFARLRDIVRHREE